MASNNPVKLAYNLFEPKGDAEDKAPILFLHGITASKENWGSIPQTVADATNRKVFALDARNHGDSEWRDSVSFDCNVDDLLHFMDTMKIPKAIIVGHSMGGIVGIKAALKKPEKIQKLIVEDMYVKTPPQEQCNTIIAYLRLATAALRQLPPGTDEETAKKSIVEFVYKNIPKEIEQKVTKRHWTDIELKATEDGRYSYKFNVDAVNKALENVAESVSLNKGVYQGPASFIFGKLSPYQVGNEKDHIKKFFPNAEFVELANATHKVHSDCPQEFTEALLKFISKK